MDNFITAFVQMLEFLLDSFLLLAPLFLVGLLLAGLIHILVPREKVLAWMQGDTLKSVFVASAIGVPLPLCSCSVVPVTAEMRRKGASKPASMAFLITTPESGVDSILVTQAFFGPIMTIIRPLASFITAVVAGIFSIGLLRKPPSKSTSVTEQQHSHCSHDHCGHDHDHDHDHDHQPMVAGKADCYVGFSGIWQAIKYSFNCQHSRLSALSISRWVKPGFYYEQQTTPKIPPLPENVVPLKKIYRHVFQYAFVDMADDILFALFIGIIAGGFIFVLLPEGLVQQASTWSIYLIMLIAGVPLYMCASASTPIAAAFVAKGVSPGAALIFLLTGPATNTATIAMIYHKFGKSFLSIYLSSIVFVSLISGILLDLFLVSTGFSIVANIDSSDHDFIGFIQRAGAIILTILIVWRFSQGAAKSGYNDLVSNIKPVVQVTKELLSRATKGNYIKGLFSLRTPAGQSLTAISLVMWLSSGLFVVPHNSVGYGLLFGKVVWNDLPPGLHYVPPWPLSRVDIWPVDEVKRVTVGVSDKGEFISGDQNILRILASLQYQVKYPYTYHYRMDNPQLIISNAMRAAIREYAATSSLEPMLTQERHLLEIHISETLSHYARNSTLKNFGIKIISANLSHIYPIEEIIGAFHEVSNAQEDHERYIYDAQREFTRLIPRTWGNAEFETEQALGRGVRIESQAKADAFAFKQIASAISELPETLMDLLWRETSEKVLAGREKYIVPATSNAGNVSIWRQSPVTSSATSTATSNTTHGNLQ